MNTLLNFAIIIGLIGPVCTHYLLRKGYEGRYLSREYLRKLSWGITRLIFPTICIYILLATDLRTFCLAVFCFNIISIGLKFALGANLKPSKSEVFGYFSYIFLFLTWQNNDPYWFQIWPTIVALVTTIFILTSMALNKPHWLITDGSIPFSRLNKVMMHIIFLFSAFFIGVGNEFFRQKTSFETWAAFNAYSLVFLVIFIGLCTIIIIPRLGDERLEAFDEERSTQ